MTNELWIGESSAKIVCEPKHTYVTLTHPGISAQTSIRQVCIRVPNTGLPDFQKVLTYAAKRVADLNRIVSDDRGTRWKSLKDAAWSLNIDEGHLRVCIESCMRLGGRIYKYV